VQTHHYNDGWRSGSETHPLPSRTSRSNRKNPRADRTALWVTSNSTTPNLPPPPGRRLLSTHKAVLVLICTGALTAAVCRWAIGNENHRDSWLSWPSALPYLIYGGHLLLAFLLTRGKLRLDWGENATWVDCVVVAAAPIVGPIIWYREWKKANKRKGKSTNAAS
jgi:hypothetical protein